MPSIHKCARTSAALALAAVTLTGACGRGKRAPHYEQEQPASDAPAPFPVALRFMDQDGMAWREIHDPARIAKLTALADNEPARLAGALYAEAWSIAPRPELDRPMLFIGLMPGGNYGRTGFGLKRGEGDEITPMPDMPYLILEDTPERFRITFLHETGHVIHSLLVGDRAGDDEAPVAPIPHSTAAVTDRRTAFNEGWAIHLEAVNAQCGTDPDTRARYDRTALQHGPVEPWNRSEYYAAAADLRSYSQNFARYWMVRDGLFAFEPATGGDYLRVQLDPARDRRELRSGGAMLASEGFVASVFFHLALRDGCAPPDELAHRYRPLLEALRNAESTRSPLDVAPIADVAFEMGNPGLRVFLDLSRGATMDAGAGALWRRFYDGALAIDRAGEQALVADIEARRRSWERDAAARPEALIRAVGPVVVAQAPGREVGLKAFGQTRPMSFDLNAAGPPLLRLVPGLTEAQVQGIVAARAEAPFASLDDFAERTRALRIPAGAIVPRPE